MWPSFWFTVVLIASTQCVNAETPPDKPKRTLNLFTRRWDWKEASDESKTEWGITLKRFYLVDNAFLQLQRLLSETLGPNEDSDLGLSNSTLVYIQKVIAKADRNLKKAEEDQNTSDATIVSMEK